MSSEQPPVQAGATVDPPHTPTPPSGRRPLSGRRSGDASRISALPTIDDVESTHTPSPSNKSRTSCDASQLSVDKAAASPCSAFYCHPTTRYSFDVQKTESKPIIDVYAVDVEKLEAARTPAFTRPKNGQCSVWPGHKSKVCRGKARWGQKRACNPMRNLDQRTRLWAKILIAFVIVAAAIAIGIGISKAVGAGAWKSPTQVQSIGPS
ncbi:MAG: hypothetical protein M1832_000388 [Thelocarpon impressellum]|nr:MAG: hypothetical protein M1832_000388 [Thelocarpon impressellum]